MTQPVKETIQWNIYILYRDNEPHALFNDIGEANLARESMTLDDRAAKFTLKAVDNSMCHFIAPVGTEAISNLGNKWVWQWVEDDKFAWTKVGSAI
jgi:hypothetical protein